MKPVSFHQKVEFMTEDAKTDKKFLNLSALNLEASSSVVKNVS
jgi:hypothetical protein